MHYSRVDATLIDNRLDASRYTREQIANLALLRAVGAVPLVSLMDERLSNYGVLPSSEEYTNSTAGVGLVRGGDLEHGYVADPSVWAPRSYSTVRGRLKIDDVLVLAKGACIDEPAGVGLISSRLTESIFNGTSYRVRLQHGDAGFFVAFCMTSSFLLQKRREISNIGISYNSEEAIKGFLVPNPSKEAQVYIGSKVRQAGALRERARNSRTAAEKLILSLLHGLTLDTQKGTQRISPQTLGERLDCNYYDALSVYVEASLSNQHRMIPLQDAIYTNRTITNGVRGPDLTESRFRLVRLQDCYDWSVHYDACLTISPAQFQDNQRCRLMVGDVVVAIGGYIGNAAAVTSECPAVIGQHSAVLPIDADGPIQPLYLTAYLNSPIATAQFKRYVSGTVQAGINLEDLRSIRVPVPPRDLQLAVVTATSAFIRGSKAARALTTAARLLVEALIERKVTEAELIAASKDPDADRALLARLKTDGLDGAGDPLFPDLDALAELFREATSLEASCLPP